jgi:plasmid replication initiation protein
MENTGALKEKYIKKHNAAIRSYSEMTLLQRKVANTLLYNAYHDLESKAFHEITISQLLSLLSMRTNDYEKLKKTILQLMSTVIEWNVIKKTEYKNETNAMELFNSKECWTACTLLSSVQIEGTTIKYEYSQVLKNLFYRPSFYSKVSLNIQNKFKSLYSLALYENCLSYLNCGSSGWVTFQMFRKIMGVGETQYKTFRDFSRRVLKPAVIEINRISDIIVGYEIKKINRSLSHIKLVVAKNITECQKLTSRAEEDDFIKNKLLEYGFSDEDSGRTIKKYGKGNILEKISLINESKLKINVPAAFLKAALKQDYKANSTKINMLKNTYLEEKETESKREQLDKKYKLYVDEQYKTWLSKLSDEEKSFLIRKTREYHEIHGVPFWKKAKIKLDSGMFSEDLDIFLCIKIFIMEKKSDLHLRIELPEILPIDQFFKVEEQ